MQEVQLQPEYSTMSRGRRNKGGKGGIGYEWYKKYKTDCYPSSYLVRNGSKLPIPHYYDKLLEEENKLLHAQVKMERELKILEYKDELTPDMLRMRLHAKTKQFETLRRNKI